ncbi:MAG: hypothetical protein ACI9GH_000320 [Candidatus Paceibacteria bacterium]|jgi:hypothetical protein
MKIEQKSWTKGDGWKTLESDLGENTPQIVFVFGGREELEEAERFNELKESYPQSKILLCSTAGEIIGTKVSDNSLAVSAVHFEKTTLEFTQTSISDPKDSEEKGKEVASKLPKEGLVHVMVFSDGLKVNGTSLVQGVLGELAPEISVTGGLVGDGANFKKTVIGLDEVPKEGGIILVGFYGESLKVGHGSLGGWDSFGPLRLITKSKGNVLYELDGKPALELYKRYLGDEAKDLPGSGLLFPLNLIIEDTDGSKSEVVRTLLAVSEEDQSMTFAGDMPEGSHANLMKANFDRLVDGAEGAAKMSSEAFTGGDPELAILISCVGRKLVLKDRIEEETEAVKSQLGENTKMVGFYSYGEISPITPTEKQCKLHNQTMTITTFKEI